MTTLTASAKKPGRPPRAFDAEQITRGLVQVIACAGNASEADRRLRAEDKTWRVPLRTLQEWHTDTHAHRYRQLERDHGRELEALAIDSARRTLTLAAEVELLGLTQMREELQARKARDPSQMALNASKIKSANVDQVLKLTGRPTEVVEHRNADDLLDSLAKKLGLALEPEPADAEVIERQELTA